MQQPTRSGRGSHRLGITVKDHKEGTDWEIN